MKTEDIKLIIKLTLLLTVLIAGTIKIINDTNKLELDYANCLESESTRVCNAYYLN